MGGQGPAPDLLGARWLTDFSPRLLLNLIYAHLVEDRPHAEKCTGLVCAPGCDWRQFRDWLEAPLAPWELREHERMRARREALMRGEIPA